jgi:hypothetical protein
LQSNSLSLPRTKVGELAEPFQGHPESANSKDPVTIQSFWSEATESSEVKRRRPPHTRTMTTKQHSCK